MPPTPTPTTMTPTPTLHHHGEPQHAFHSRTPVAALSRTLLRVMFIHCFFLFCFFSFGASRQGSWMAPVLMLHHEPMSDAACRAHRETKEADVTLSLAVHDERHRSSVHGADWHAPSSTDGVSYARIHTHTHTWGRGICLAACCLR